jgi:predicted Zn-ribbon and HTH transcriptional regulator
VAGNYALYLPIHTITALETEGFTDAEIGLFIRGVIKYHTDGTIPKFKDRALSLLFRNCKQGFDYNIEKYERVVGARRENGKKGGASTSENKKTAARINGKKGGAPKKDQSPELEKQPKQTGHLLGLNNDNKKQPKQNKITQAVLVLESESELEKNSSSSKRAVVSLKQPITTTLFLNLCKKYGYNFDKQKMRELCAGIDPSWLSVAFTYPDFIAETVEENYGDKPQDEKTRLFITLFKAEDRKAAFLQWKQEREAEEVRKIKAHYLEEAFKNHPTKCEYCGGEDFREFDNSYQCRKCYAISSFNKDKLKWEWRQ